MPIGSTVVVVVLCVACEAGGVNGCDDTIHNIETVHSFFVQVPSFITRLLGQYCIIDDIASVRLQSAVHRVHASMLQMLKRKWLMYNYVSNKRSLSSLWF